MSWLRKPLTILAAIAIGFGAMAAKKDDQTDPPDKVEKKKDRKSGKGDATPAPDDGSPKKMSIPLPVGHDAKMLVIPYRDGEGKLQMRFAMEIGKRIDPDHMDMTTLRIETFDEDGKPEMTIDLPRSILDLNTRVISTEHGVLIKRSDFELTGKSMVFNTDTKQGHIAGNVHMLIYNLDDETNANPEEKTSEK